MEEDKQGDGQLNGKASGPHAAHDDGGIRRGRTISRNFPFYFQETSESDAFTA